MTTLSMPTYSARADRVARHAVAVSPSRAARNVALFLPWLIGFVAYWSWSGVVFVAMWIWFGLCEGFDWGKSAKAKLNPRESRGG